MVHSGSKKTTSNNLMNIFLETVGTAKVNHFLVRFWRGRVGTLGTLGTLGFQRCRLSWLKPLSTHRPDTSSKCGSWRPTSLVRAPRAKRWVAIPTLQFDCRDVIYVGMNLQGMCDGFQIGIWSSASGSRHLTC